MASTLTFFSAFNSVTSCSVAYVDKLNISTLKQFKNIPFCTISGYITAVYDSLWAEHVIQNSDKLQKSTSNFYIHMDLSHTLFNYMN